MEALHGAVFRLEQGFELQFRLGPTLQGKEVRVYTNYPAGGLRVDRLKFAPLDWVYPNGPEDDRDKYCRLDLMVAGSYQYHFSCGDQQEVGGGYIMVEPVLTVGVNNDVLPFNSISSQTYQTGRLGPLDQWLDRLRVAKETGYNMIHFSPLQRLGVSGCRAVADQLQLNSDCSPEGRRCTWTDVGRLLDTLRKDWSMLAITDVIYSHTAADSEWVLLHPECGYNLVNSPYLRPAWLLDRALWRLSGEVADGKYCEQGVPALIHEEQHVQSLWSILQQQVFSRLRLWEFLQVDVDEAVEQFRVLLETSDRLESRPERKQQLKMVQDPRYRRFGNTVDMSGALDLLLPPSLNQSDVPDCCDAFRRRLEELNFDLYREMNQHAAQAIDCIVGNVVYERVAAEGPQLGKVTRKHPLCPRYFLFPFEEMSVEEEEQLMEQRQKACLLLACDGWVKGDDVIRNFAESGSDVYLRRELVCLEDTIKLRYGEKPEDCPYLWSHMTTYTEMTARLFSGVQLVRCLSTPLHVTQAMLAAARAVRSNLYVAADLSTADQVMESVYVNRLGISSLVRGAAAADSAGLCREPVGAFIQPSLRPLIPATPHTMFMDSPDSHSNMESSVLDILPTSVLVSMSCGATCSSRGHDEMLHQRSEVREDPQYSFWDRVGLQTGMLAVKLVLNRLHQQMAAEGFTQVCVEQLEGGVVTVTRCCPSSQQSVVAVLWRDIKTPEKHHPPDAASIFLPGRVEEVLLEAQTFVRRNNMTDDKDMNDPADWTVEVKEHIQLEDSRAVKRAGVVSGPGRGGEEVVLERFTPGSAIIFRVGLDPLSRQQLGSLRRHLIQFGPQYQNGSLAEPGPPSVLSRPLMTIMERLTLADLNILLYRCDAEEREEGGGCYHIPSGAPLSYGGLQGLMSVLAEIRPQNDLGHPFCENLRHGDWMMDYVSNRLLSRGGAVGEVGLWFQAMFVYLKNLPRYLLPCYFDAIIQGAFRTALTAVFNHMSRFVQDGSSLVKQLSLGSVQMCGVSPSWTPPPLSPHLKDGTHPLSDVTNQEDHRCVSLAAGLPHFCAGTFRCWGRDTFVSVRGLLLLTGRHLEARNVLLSFAGTLRYGLIANLLGLSGSARYNSRDAVWWWLQCVQEFCSLVPDGISILRCPVSRIYPTNGSQPQPAGAWNQPLCDVIQEVMQRHLQGIRFRETDAGQSDRNITDEGYNVEAGVDQTTGFIYGGNRSNCGTWMDKMGESERAHNKGIPATPRDGSAVELVGLCKSAVRWLVELHSNGNFPYVSVSIHRGGQTYSVSYVEWNRKIQENFERKFYISPDPQNPEEDRPELVHKRGIYKDSVGASSPWCDYQLRPNFPIAMTVAPELFSVEKAWEALTVAEKKLLGPLGMKTLDPDDLVYCGVYNNNLDNDNFHQARGFNYHQGPEWLWPVGYFLRAKLYFAKKLGKEMYERTVKVVKNILSRHAVHLERSPWKGLPELTNEDGRPCSFSCDSHASSMAAILEVLYDLSSAAQRTRV